jgi:hypothetical protein
VLRFANGWERVMDGRGEGGETERETALSLIFTKTGWERGM